MTIVMPHVAVSVRDLEVSYFRWGQRVAVIQQVSLDVAAGEWLLLVGHNGAGKSTLVKAISGQIKPDTGKVLIAEKPVHGLKPRQLAAMVFVVHQDPLMGTAPLLTVFENLRVADGRAQGTDATKSALMERYASLLTPIGLAERMRQPVRVLSGGERQLLALAIARLRDAPVILLDEPLAALDPAKTELCIDEIAAMHREGKTIIQVTHHMRGLQSRADRVLALEGGRIASAANVAAEKRVVAASVAEG